MEDVMDFSQITICQMTPKNQFIYDASEHEKAILRADRHRRNMHFLLKSVLDFLKRQVAAYAQPMARPNFEK